jgi:hypothetical protein
MTLSLRQYAARRRAAGLPGSLASVQRAIAEGRITAAALTPDGQIADPELADRDWPRPQRRRAPPRPRPRSTSPTTCRRSR